MMRGTALLHSFHGPLPLTLTILLGYFITAISGFRFNGSCSSSIECLPRETFMRCVKGHCLCAADSNYDIKNGYCRLKINVKCYLSGNKAQPCVRGAFCDPPSFADGSKILAASTGNCKCYQGESNEEDGTCSSANSLQRSFGHSSLIFGSACETIVVWVVSISVTVFNNCMWWSGR